MLTREEALQVYCAIIASGNYKLNFSSSDTWKHFDIEYYLYKNSIKIDSGSAGLQVRLTNEGTMRVKIKCLDGAVESIGYPGYPVEFDVEPMGWIEIDKCLLKTIAVEHLEL